MATNLTGLPPGFVLDEPEIQEKISPQQLPAGFILDEPTPTLRGGIEKTFDAISRAIPEPPTTLPEPTGLAKVYDPSEIIPSAIRGFQKPFRAVGRAITDIIPPSEEYKRFRREYEQGQAPKGIAGEIAAGAGELGAYGLLPEATLAKIPQYASRLLSGLFQGGAIGGIEALEREKGLRDVGIETAKGAGVGTGVAGLLSSISPAIQKTKGLFGKIAKGFAGVPKEATARAFEKELAGKSVFRKEWGELEGKFKTVYSDLGKKTTKAYNEIKKVAGEATKIERDSLRGLDEIVGVQPFIDNVKKLKADTYFQGKSTLSAKDLKIINEHLKILENYKKSIKKGMTAGQLHVEKTKLQNEFLSFDPNEVKKVGTVGHGILKQLRNAFDDALGQLSPQYKAANKNYSEIRNIQTELGSSIKDKNIAKTLRGLDEKDEVTQSLIKKIDELAPENLKFMDELQDIKAMSEFETFFPRKPSKIAAPLAGGAVTGLAFGAGIPSGILAALPLISPKVYGAGIRGSVGLERLLQDKTLHPAIRKMILQQLQTRE